jgi:hypothetical protein
MLLSDFADRFPTDPHVEAARIKDGQKVPSEPFVAVFSVLRAEFLLWKGVVNELRIASRWTSSASYYYILIGATK